MLTELWLFSYVLYAVTAAFIMKLFCENLILICCTWYCDSLIPFGLPSSTMPKYTDPPLPVFKKPLIALKGIQYYIFSVFSSNYPKYLVRKQYWRTTWFDYFNVYVIITIRSIVFINFLRTDLISYYFKNFTVKARKLLFVNTTTQHPS